MDMTDLTPAERETLARLLERQAAATSTAGADAFAAILAGMTLKEQRHLPASLRGPLPTIQNNADTGEAKEA